jgi:hypothetical protein
LKDEAVIRDGKVRIDAEALKARHAAQIKRLAGYGPFSLIVLGAAHDLTRELDEQTEYVRVFVRTAPEVPHE